MSAAVVGLGAVGARAARQLHTLGVAVTRVVDIRDGHAAAVASSLGGVSRPAGWAEALTARLDVVVLAHPGAHREHALRAMEAGFHVVSVSSDADCARSLLDLDAEAAERGLIVAVGAGFSPGLSCVLARHAAEGFSEVDEVHVAWAGTGGPGCAGERRRALRTPGTAWHDGAWRRAGAGRHLVWFPDPVGARECNAGAAPDPLLLQPAFPGASRITARTATSVAERLAARLPAFGRARVESGPGAIHVEVRGRRGTGTDTAVLGAVDRPGLAAGTVAAVTAHSIVTGAIDRRGAGGLATLVGDTRAFLRSLADLGVKAAVFEGTG